MDALGHSGIGSKSRRHIRWFSRRRIATDEGGTEMTTKSRPLARAFALALVLALPLLVVHAQPASVVTVVDPVPPLATTDWLVGTSA